ncbi:MAG: hypothetical protein WEB30_07695 [Cyclobacteriaceae bacterium]
MRVSKVLLASLITLVASECVYAQRSGKVTKSRFHYSTPKVRGNKAKIICPIFTNSKYPFHGLGFKLGDPFALTYKYYPNKRFSFAADVGKAASGLYNRYFREKFNFYAMEDTLPSDGSALVYLTHRVKSDLIGELKVLYHVDGKRISDGLQAYIGVGWEWKRTRLQYDYQYFEGGSNPPPSDPFGSFERSRVTMGPQVMLGIEYAYFRIPISAFMEVEYFSDIQADPGWQRFEGGVGLRYIF